MDKNTLICGDNLSALDDLVKKEIGVDLICLYPHFLVNDITKRFGKTRAEKMKKN